MCGLATTPFASHDLDFFLFDDYVRSLDEAFPQGVLVLPFEEFVADPESFLGKLSRFIDVPPPRVELGIHRASGVDDFLLGSLRQLNRILRTVVNPYGPLRGIPIPGRSGQTLYVNPSQFIIERWPFATGASGQRRLRGRTKALLEICASDNRALDERLGLGLREYGYWQ
jgi:hypothetical protein